MKKRILSVILGLAMVATMLIMPVAAAVDLDADTIPAIADNASLSMILPNSGANATYFYFDEISENATLTFYFKPGANYNTTATAPFVFSLCNSANYSNVIAKFYSAMDVDKTVFMGAEGRGIYWWAGYRGALAQPIVSDEWNRYDLTVDFTNKKATGYLNYTLIEQVDFLGDFTSFNALAITNEKGGYYGDSNANIDNFIITKGINAPAAGDIASGITAEKLAANKANILHAETFDSTTNFAIADNAYEAGKVCTANTNSGFLGLSSTVGMTAADGLYKMNIKDDYGLNLLTYNSNATGAYVFTGEVSQNATVTMFFKPSETYFDAQDGFAFQLIDANGKVVTMLNTNAYGGNGSTLYLDDGTRGINYSGWSGENAQKLNKSEWNRLDILVDFENNQATAYVNYNSLGTLSFHSEVEGQADSFIGVQIKSFRNTYISTNRASFDNLIVTAGLNTPSLKDVAAYLTGDTYSANADKVLFVETFEPGTEIKTGAATPTSQNKGEIWNARADGNTGFCSIEKGHGVTAVKPVIEYTVTWDIDGVITTETVAEGTVPTAPTNTDKAADEEYTYTFIGWDKEIVAVTEDVTYTAQYEATAIEPEPETTPAPETDPEPETTPAPETDPEPETTPAPETDPEPETTPAPETDPVTEAPTTEAPKPEGGCGGVSLGAIIALAVGMFGLGFTVIKKK